MNEAGGEPDHTLIKNLKHNLGKAAEKVNSKF